MQMRVYTPALHTAKSSRRAKHIVLEQPKTRDFAVAPTDDLAELDQGLAVLLQEEVRCFTQRRALLARSSDHCTACPSTATQSHAHVSPVPSATGMPAKLSPVELIHFVAQQVQQLTKVLTANLAPLS